MSTNSVAGRVGVGGTATLTGYTLGSSLQPPSAVPRYDLIAYKGLWKTVSAELRGDGEIIYTDPTSDFSQALYHNPPLSGPAATYKRDTYLWFKIARSQIQYGSFYLAQLVDTGTVSTDGNTPA